MSDDIVAFLTARYAELEQKAQAAMAGPGQYIFAYPDGPIDGRYGEWRECPDDGVWTADGCRVEGVGVTIYDEGGHNEAQAEHIAANDPQFVLADVAAKRAILAEYVAAERLAVEQAPSWAEKSRRTQRAADLLDVVRLLAAPFAGHPAFRDEWRAP